MHKRMHEQTQDITELILKAKARAYEGMDITPQPAMANKIDWPINCTVGPGLEGAIACETKIGYVDGSKGRLIYQGYDIFDLCAHSTFEEVSYLLFHGHLPNRSQMETYNQKLISFRELPNTLRRMMGVPVEEMNPMAALHLGTSFMRQRLTWRDTEGGQPSSEDAIAADEDSIPMETRPMGEKQAIYEFTTAPKPRPEGVRSTTDDAASMPACMHLVAGLATLAAAARRLREGKLPIEPDPELSHAANFLYMMTGKRPTPEQERIMDISLILHADHGMNASTFAAMVVASTLSDIYFSVVAGIAALNGPLHGGANEQVINVLEEIGSADNVDDWFEKARKQKKKISGFGHRVYKTYDPRALVLCPLAESLAHRYPDVRPMYQTARALEKTVVTNLGKQKKVFPNVDFYSGIVYRTMGIPTDMFPSVFAVSRVAGWTARVHEYLKHNRIFRPRAIYVGEFDRDYAAIDTRD